MLGKRRAGSGDSERSSKRQGREVSDGEMEAWRRELEEEGQKVAERVREKFREESEETSASTKRRRAVEQEESGSEMEVKEESKEDWEIGG